MTMRPTAAIILAERNCLREAESRERDGATRPMKQNGL